MKNSAKDWILVLVSALLPVLIVSWAINFSALSMLENLGIFAIATSWFWYNAMIATHNFIHTPFFKSESINWVYRFISSMNINVPHIMFHYHHMQHHSHNNSLKDPSSTLTYGKDGKQESWISYCSLAPYRQGTIDMFKLAIKKGRGGDLLANVIAVISYWVILGSIDLMFLPVYALVTYVGWFFCSMENYYEHHRAKNFNDRYANSVSYYGEIYNKLFFNVGFHQEHHIEPQTHWSRAKEVRKKYQERMLSNGAFVSNKPPLLGLIASRFSNT